MKVLIVRVGAMGDVVHALPAVAALRRAKPDWAIDWAIDPRWSPLLVEEGGFGPLVNRVAMAETRLWKRHPWSLKTVRSVLGLRRELRHRRYDVVVDVQGTIRSGVIGWMARGKTFAGYANPRESAAAWFYGQKLQRKGVHVVEQGAALLGEACGVALSPEELLMSPELPLDPGAELWAAEQVGEAPVCLLAPGAGWGSKRWPAERYGALARAMRAKGFTVLVNAARLEDRAADQVVVSSKGTAESVICKVGGLISLLRRTAVVVGGDSGPVHLAAAMGVPVVTLFGPTDPARNRPWGPGRIEVLRDAASITSYRKMDMVDSGLLRISPEQVVAAVESLI